MDIIKLLPTHLHNSLPEGVYLGGQEILASEAEKLFPEEHFYIQGSVAKRQCEFACGRSVARQILVKFGYSDFPILKDEKGCPIWPDGITGSITHTDTNCLVAIARSHKVRSLGIDLEPVNSVDSSLWPFLFTDKEISHLKKQNDTESRQNLAAVFFVAKEAFYKCNYPIDKRWVDFKEISVKFDVQSRRISFFDQNGSLQKAYTGISTTYSDHVFSFVWYVDTDTQF